MNKYDTAATRDAAQKRRLIGERIRTARLLMRLGQGPAAKLLGVSQQTLSGWENGKSLPALNVVVEFCMNFGVTPNFILLADASPTGVAHNVIAKAVPVAEVF